MNLILASGSPRRRELLAVLGHPFTVCAADVDEKMDPSRGAESEVARVSARKAEAVAALQRSDAVVLAADTIVCVDDRILGKPADTAEAAAMLRQLSGRSHLVRTGVTLISGEKQLTEVETTEVFFRPLTEEEIAVYIASGEPMDKAGAYGIQGRAAVFIEGIRGDYYNVMGLPLCRLSKMLAALDMRQR